MIARWAGIYCALLLIFGGFVYGSGVVFPPQGNIIFQVLTTVVIVIMAYALLSRTVSHRTLLCGLLVFQIVATLALRWYNYMQWGNYLGANPVDAAVYDEVATNLAHADGSLIGRLKTMNTYMDDLGFIAIISFVYSVFGPALGIHMLALLNCFVVVGSANLLYRLAMMLSFERNDANFLCFLWGVMPFSIYTSCAGLKENFMLLCIIGAIYYIYRCVEYRKPKQFVFAGLFIASLFFFRTAIGIILILTFLLALAVRFQFVYKYIKLWTVLVLIAAALLFNEFVVYSYTMRGGDGDAEQFLGVLDRKTEATGGAIGAVTNVVAALIGPFVSIVSTSIGKANYITLDSFGTMIKMMLSLGFVYGLYKIFRDKVVSLFPIALFVVLHIVMLIFTFYTLHVRFQWPHMPFVFLIAIYGLKRMQDSKLQKFKIQQVYALAVVGVIVLYNLRLM